MTARRPVRNHRSRGQQPRAGHQLKPNGTAPPRPRATPTVAMAPMKERTVFTLHLLINSRVESLPAGDGRRPPRLWPCRRDQRRRWHGGRQGSHSRRQWRPAGRHPREGSANVRHHGGDCTHRERAGKEGKAASTRKRAAERSASGAKGRGVADHALGTQVTWMTSRGCGTMLSATPSRPQFASPTKQGGPFIAADQSGPKAISRIRLAAQERKNHTRSSLESSQLQFSTVCAVRMYSTYIHTCTVCALRPCGTSRPIHFAWPRRGPPAKGGCAPSGTPPRHLTFPDKGPTVGC